MTGNLVGSGRRVAMQVVIEGEAAAIVERLVRSGRFASARDVAEHAMRLAEAEEERLGWLRAKVAEAEDRSGDMTAAEVEAGLEPLFAELEQELR